MADATKNTYLIALPIFKGSKGFCHPTILVSAKDEDDAIAIALSKKGNVNIGDVKKVSY